MHSHQQAISEAIELQQSKWKLILTQEEPRGSCLFRRILLII
ncbi:unnamed protein product [Larinioides sclopetarius]|uniref:Uncharacterized protein n=1 Tax=Larinioides sclopetarius TaxID=280406 RepID=A0AAV2AED7_9ARAC